MSEVAPGGNTCLATAGQDHSTDQSHDQRSQVSRIRWQAAHRSAGKFGQCVPSSAMLVPVAGAGVPAGAESCWVSSVLDGITSSAPEFAGREVPLLLSSRLSILTVCGTSVVSLTFLQAPTEVRHNLWMRHYVLILIADDCMLPLTRLMIHQLTGQHKTGCISVSQTCLQAIHQAIPASKLVWNKIFQCL